MHVPPFVLQVSHLATYVALSRYACTTFSYSVFNLCMCIAWLRVTLLVVQVLAIYMLFLAIYMLFLAIYMLFLAIYMLFLAIYMLFLATHVPFQLCMYRFNDVLILFSYLCVAFRSAGWKEYR